MVSIPTHHIPRTDCPYTTDIYFISIREPEEPDPSQKKDCTTPGWLAPYKGKYEVPNTTPDALQCQQLMAGMLDNGANAVAMEVSSHALAQGRVDCVDFDVAVFTNLTTDHLDFHGDMATYREAKALLFKQLTDPERQRAVINLDPSHVEAEKKKTSTKKKDVESDEDDSDAPNEPEPEPTEPTAAFDESAFFITAAGSGDRVPIITYATHVRAFPTHHIPPP